MRLRLTRQPEALGAAPLEPAREAAGGEPEVERGLDEVGHLRLVVDAPGAVDPVLARDEGALLAGAQPRELGDELGDLTAELAFACVHGVCRSDLS
jgi:hypothetical protein